MTETHNVTQLKDYIVDLLDAKKAFDITSIDLTNKSSLASHIIIASGTSIKHVSSIADAISLDVKHKFRQNVLIEGMGSSNWVVLDVKDIVVHIFYPETREYYQLEEIYNR